ncbi:MAG TPA: hypothetical protein VGM17_01450 [Rhizomicrobium sp.]|jgi:hypothetical protein
MADTSGRIHTTADLTKEKFEQEKLEALSAFLKNARNFMEHDEAMNREILKAFSAAVAEYIKNPGVQTSGGGNIDALINALKARSAGEMGPTGGDIVGGDWFTDLMDAIIKSLASEKDFIMGIIRLIFCGC